MSNDTKTPIDFDNMLPSKSVEYDANGREIGTETFTRLPGGRVVRSYKLATVRIPAAVHQAAPSELAALIRANRRT